MSILQVEEGSHGHSKLVENRAEGIEQIVYSDSTNPATTIGAKSGFTVGICATGDALRLPSLLDSVVHEAPPAGFELRKIVLVASECNSRVLDHARRIARSETRMVLLEEPERRGKAAAVNRIIENCKGEFLVLVNSDALPRVGAIRRLLESVHIDEAAGVVSGRPVFDRRSGATFGLLDLMWTIHNKCSLVLNHQGMSNHCTDELMLVRVSALRKLPDGLVNDGAYIAGTAKLLGYSVRFCEGASVSIDLPSRIVDVVRQRRRILFGHFQVWRMTNRIPKTVESLLLIKPLISFQIAARTIAENPKLILVLPLALVSETASLLLAIGDVARSTKRHRVWRRYGN